MAIFKAEGIDLTLELNGLKKENGSVESKKYLTREPITADFSERVLKELGIYLEAQKDLPISEQDKVFLANLKFLSWVYNGFEVDWVKTNFNPTEINEIKNWAFQGLMGVKKEEES